MKKNKNNNKPCTISNVRRSALEWWSLLTDSEKRTAELNVFGEGEVWEDNTLTDKDIELIYLEHGHYA